MRTWMRRAGIALAVLGGLALADSARTRADDRKPAEILKEIKAVKAPQFSRQDAGNQEAIQKYLEESRKVAARKAELIGELYQADPSNKELPGLLPERWAALLMSGPEAVDEVTGEIDKVLPKAKDEKLKVEGSFLKARALLMKDEA